MKYYINKTINADLETATEKIKEELQKEGFGIVTQFDVNKALKEKLDVDFRQYRILGACNPQYALKAVTAEDKIGVILPCNVMLQQINDEIEISIINPSFMVKDIDNQAMKSIAKTIFKRLEEALNRL